LTNQITTQTGADMDEVREQYLKEIENSLRKLMFMTGLKSASEAQLLSMEILDKIEDIRKELAK